MADILSFDVSTIPDDFDPVTYLEDFPETASFYQPFCQLNGISDKQRLFYHYINYFKPRKVSYKISYTRARHLFSNSKYNECFLYLMKDLDFVFSQHKYYPFGYWLIESSIQSLNTSKLDHALRALPESTMRSKCLLALRSLNKSAPYKCTSEKHIVAYAFNGNYLEAFKTSLYSLIVNNSHMLSSLLFVIGIDDTVDRQVINSFLLNQNIQFELVDLSFCATNELKEEYGITSEFKLDKSAYYRIFLLKMIVSKFKKTHQRALYLDADTLVLSDLAHLIEDDFTLPLKAKLDHHDSELVQRSKLENSIDKYFNSGVLLFNLKNNQLEICIERTIEAALDEQDRLYMQDQCALNIGFNTFVDELNGRYNYMLHFEEISNNADCAILHFTGRIKPWSPHYQDQPISRCLWLNNHRAATGQMFFKKNS